jgi:hypothetical protein
MWSFGIAGYADPETRGENTVCAPFSCQGFVKSVSKSPEIAGGASLLKAQLSSDLQNNRWNSTNTGACPHKDLCLRLFIKKSFPIMVHPREPEG